MNPIDRDELIQHSWDILMFILFQPQTNMALLLYLSVGVLVMAFGLAKAHGLASAGSSSPLLGILTGAFCLFAMVQITALLQIYAVPYFSNPSMRLPGLIAGIITAFMLMIVPFTRMWFRSGYWATVAAWSLALLLGVLTVFGLKQAYDPKPAKPEDALKSFGSFGSQMKKDLKDKIKERTEPSEPTEQAPVDP